MSASPPFDPLLAAGRHELDSASVGRLALYLAQGPVAPGAEGAAPPLLLVHSVNAAASVAEVRPVFEGESARRTVVALDLPGFGRSSRERRDYSPRLMTDAVQAAGRWARERLGVAQLDVLALSLSCEFAARAAVEEPAAWRRLALVSPTGFNGTRRRRGPPGSVLGPPALKRVLTWEPLGGPMFRALTRPGVVRYFLRRTYGARDIDEQLWRDAVATARESGAERAPLHFLSAALFSADINDVYERLVQPVWMSHGTRGDFTDYRGTGSLAGRANWRFSVFETGAMPYFERPAAFRDELRAFLDAP
ncbi:MAG: alpha/beta fold hydrolase [Rubrivivax sp.]